MRISKNIKAVLFDNDGTLSNSVPIIIRATNNALRLAGFTPVHDEEIIDGMRIKTTLRMMNHVQTGDEQVGLDLAAGFYDQMDVLLDEIPAFPGIQSGLKALESLGYPMGIVSNNISFVVDRVLRGNNIRHYFSVLIGEDNTEQTKPGPGGLLQACRIMGVDPDTCVYVGDSLSDCDSAAAAGMKSIGVTWNEYDPIDVRTLGFTATIDSMDELLPAIYSFG